MYTYILLFIDIIYTYCILLIIDNTTWMLHLKKQNIR